MDGKYSKYYSEDSLWEKVRKFAKDAGAKVVYAVLLLFYSLQDKSVGLKTKLAISAALGYFILPTDAILDFTPLIGYSDDLGVLLFALSQISGSLTPEVKKKARMKLDEWFTEINPGDIQEIDDKTNFEND